MLEGVGHGWCPGKGFGGANEGISERSEKSSGMRKETVVKVNEAEETLELFDGDRSRIVGNSLDMRRKGSNASGGDMMAEKVNRGLGKRGLGEVNEEVISGQDREELVEVVKV